MAEDLRRRAAAAVYYERPSARRIKGIIATNPKFRQRELSDKDGVDPDPAKSPEVVPAQEALVRGTLEQFAEIVPVLSIQQWIAREEKKRGGAPKGKGKLTADLLGIPYQGVTKNPRYKALLRAIQRSANPTAQTRKEAHKGLAKPEYRDLIANLAGAEMGNPYTPAPLRARAALRASKVQLDIYGFWRISDEEYDGYWKGSDLVASTLFTPVWSFPDLFIEETLAYMRGTYLRAAFEASGVVELDWLYGLSLLIELPEATNG